MRAKCSQERAGSTPASGTNLEGDQTGDVCAVSKAVGAERPGVQFRPPSADKYHMFDQPTEWKWIKENEETAEGFGDSEWEAEFTILDQLQRPQIYRVCIASKDKENWNVFFYKVGVENIFKGERNGKELLIYSTAINIARTFIREQEPKVIFFSSKRKRLFSSLYKKRAPVLRIQGYEVTERLLKDETIYIMTRMY